MQMIVENESRIVISKANEQSSELSQRVPHRSVVVSEDTSYTQSTVGNTGEGMGPKEHTVLGTRWNHEDDTFIFNFDSVVSVANTSAPTKRHVISVSSRIYDPLGLLSPVTIQLKMLFQEICKRKIDWNSELDEDL